MIKFIKQKLCKHDLSLIVYNETCDLYKCNKCGLHYIYDKIINKYIKIEDKFYHIIFDMNFRIIGFID